jgi:glycosyltransferase involved in cell wall biosynthesis
VVAQSYPRIEVVVVDDGSDDGTEDIVRRTPDPRIRYVRQEPGGAAAARNLGVRLACGAYLSFLDADDVSADAAEPGELPDERLALLLRRFRESIGPLTDDPEVGDRPPHH